MIDYSEDWFWKLVFRWDGSVGLRAAWFGVPAALLSLALLVLEDYDPSFRESIELADPLSGSAIWASATSALMLLITVRTGRGIARFWEGTGLMHMMRGEWYYNFYYVLGRSFSQLHTAIGLSFQSKAEVDLNLITGAARDEKGISSTPQTRSTMIVSRTTFVSCFCSIAPGTIDRCNCK